ncbi:MAG: tetratricopeptide repeat protein [Deltaproteobacteria bacterium]|nr:tetratricopeptide repeat protein [Deltaproteobacteria bacterium]
MIWSKRLFPGKSLEVLRRKLAATEPDCSLPPGTPSGTRLTTLIRACIQSDPRRRPSLATFNEGIEALRAEWLSGAGSPTPAPGATARELATVDLSPPLPLGPGGPQPTLAARPWDAPAADSALGSALRSGPPISPGSTPPASAPSAPAAPAPAPDAPIPPAPSPLAMFDRPPNRPPVSSLPPAPLPIPARQSAPPRRWMTYFLSGVLVLLLPLVFSERLREEVIGEAIAFVAPRLLGPATTVPAPRAEDWARLDSILAKVPTDTRESPEALLVQARVVARADRHHEYQEALRQITRALAQRPRDPSLMAEWVRVLAIARGSTFSQEDRSNAEALLSIASLLRPELPGLDGARAELALRDGRTAEAARRAQAALRKIPDQGAVRLTLAEAWSHTDPQRALAELELAERTEPGHRRADRISARAQAKIGRPRAAFELLQKRLRSDPRNAAVLTLYGDLERMVGNPQRALARYEAAIAGEGEPWPAKIALGWTHLELRNFGKAEEVFLEATKSGVEGTSALAEARLGLARVALARGDRLVTNELKEALQRSSDPASRLAAAEILAASGAFSTAEELLRTLTTDPLTARSAWLLLAKAVTARADEEGAEEARSKALEIAPGDPVLRVVLGAAAMEKGLHPRAQELIKGTALRDPRDLAAESIDVRAPLPRFLLDEVSARWKLAGQDPTHAALAETALAILALHQGGHQDARQYARRAVELDPTGARGARAVLVQAALSQGNPGEALAQAELWSKLDPELTGPHLGRARALSQLNKREDALIAYERALQLDPSLSLAALERRALLAANDPRALAELLGSTLNDRLDWPAALRLAFALGL